MHWNLLQIVGKTPDSKARKILEDRHLSFTLLENLKIFIIIYQVRRNILAWMDH
jgi:hypothetical protein